MEAADSPPSIWANVISLQNIVAKKKKNVSVVHAKHYPSADQEADKGNNCTNMQVKNTSV